MEATVNGRENSLPLQHHQRRNLYATPRRLQNARRVARLYKCIYGLKQLAREWYECLSTLLQQTGSLSSESDPCVSVYTAKSTFVSTYVDDLGIFGPNNNSPFIKEVKDKLPTRFKCKDLGDAHYILELEITYPPTGIDISQTAHKKTPTRYGMSEPRPVPHHSIRISQYGKRNQAQKSRISVNTKAS